MDKRTFKICEDVLVTDNRNLLDKVKKLEERLHENAEHFKRNEAQIIENADKVIAEKDKEIAGLKAAAKEPSVPNRTCRKCGSAGTLMYMPIVKDGRTYWDLYNNKGMDYVVGIQCAHCGEVAFVTKQTHEYELRKQKYKRCLAMAKWCKTSARCDEGLGAFKYRDWYWKWFKRWMKLAEQFKEAK